jgi:two-component system sensor histidine kinase HydH
VSTDPKDRLEDAGLAKTALIRELVDLSRFTEGILRTLGSAVVAVADDGRVTFVNPAAEQLLGLPASRLMNRPVDEILVTRGGGSLIVDTPLPDATGEVDLVLSDGRLVTVEVRLSLQESEEGQRGLVAILTDRTDLKRAEQEARRKERLASLGELSAGIAHEIRNPLTGIGASAQLLRSRLSGDDDHVRLADLILGEVARLDRIVENVLQFARPTQPTLRPASVRECMEKAITLVTEEAAEAGVRVETASDPDIPRVWIDPDQIEQVLLNLMKNALQAMEGGAGTLKMVLRKVSRRPYMRRQTGRREEDQGRLGGGEVPLQDWVEIEVTDSGHGMESEDLDRIFNPFYTTRKQGTGLGLSITQAIVQEHGGMISVSSQPGEGTTILVDLPEDKRRRQRRRDA